ncbi:hypothetical protein GGG16DRAFT_108709 [Schizophyllum commune]
MVPLSEKAKGKRRAVDIDAQGASSSSSAAQPQERQLVVRFTEGADLTITIDQLDTVKDVLNKIRTQRPDLRNRRLRLIYAGRLLTNDVFVFQHLAAVDERARRRDAAKQDAGGIQHDTHNTWIHCNVGPEIQPGEEEEGEARVQTSQIQVVRGFDRLASLGFSEADIANFRRQFHGRLANFSDTDFATEEEYRDYTRTLEEQWIDSMDGGGAGDLTPANAAASSTPLQGFLMGFFFPLLPFFFIAVPQPAAFWDDGRPLESQDSVVFSTSMRIWIGFGFVANITLALWRVFFYDAVE